ncbi:peptidoglycan DD-metalloendopeptidase family protein [Patescibacteria group bacterium]|nr:peptidoglycan DD-metalloendopeptidase family protein [Patescibacteria group bacterium]
MKKNLFIFTYFILVIPFFVLIISPTAFADDADCRACVSECVQAGMGTPNQCESGWCVDQGRCREDSGSFSCEWGGGGCYENLTNSCGDGFSPRPTQCESIDNESECSEAEFLCRASAGAERPRNRVSCTGAVQEDIQIGLADKITNLFNWAVSLAGLLALGIIIYGGVSYAASAGNPSRITEAKKWITSAFLGLGLLFGSYLILGFINPNLTRIEDIFLEANPEACSTGLQLGAGGASRFPPGVVIDENGRTCPIPEGGDRTFVSAFGDPRPCGSTSNCNWSIVPPLTLCNPGFDWTNESTADHCSHEGIDIGHGCGDPLVAIEDGVIDGAGFNDIAGNRLYLQTPGGRRYYYAHLESIAVENGQEVQAGELVGILGGTGSANGNCHLHTGYKETSGGPYVNPTALLINDLCK